LSWGDAGPPQWIALGGQQGGQLSLNPRKGLLGMFVASGVVLFSRAAPSLHLQQFILGRFAVLEAMIPAMLRTVTLADSFMKSARRSPRPLL